MHHATLYIGPLEEALTILPEDERIPSTDSRHIVSEQFGITDARELSREASLRPVVRTHRTFLISFTRATHEAQNALLKTLEEPALTSRFWIVVPHEDVLIPTVRSRLRTVDRVSTALPAPSAIAEAFCAASLAERMSLIAEKAKAKEHAWMHELLAGLEIHAHHTGNNSLMRELIFVQTHFNSSGASKKMLLEHLSLADF